MIQEFKTIDAKIKEIYYTARPIEEDRGTIESRYKFWNTLNVMAINNMSIQQVKMRA